MINKKLKFRIFLNLILHYKMITLQYKLNRLDYIKFQFDQIFKK